MIDVAELKKQVSYNPLTGELTWLVGRMVGKPAFNCPDSGYYTGKFQQIKIRAHQAAWAIYYGVWPSFPIDHDDGDGFNNRIQNLLDGGNGRNQRNKAPHRKNSNLPSGVKFDKRAKSNPYRAFVGELGKEKYLGCFPTAQDAHQAYLLEANKLGYSKRHGR